jgi:hypothetical protein
MTRTLRRICWISGLLLVVMALTFSIVCFTPRRFSRTVWFSSSVTSAMLRRMSLIWSWPSWLPTVFFSELVTSLMSTRISAICPWIESIVGSEMRPVISPPSGMTSLPSVPGVSTM